MRMKIAISIPDAVFEAAERLVHERGIARSRLYAEALREYLAAQGPEAITARLNAVYEQEAAGLDADLMRAQSGAIADESW